MKFVVGQRVRIRLEDAVPPQSHGSFPNPCFGHVSDIGEMEDWLGEGDDFELMIYPPKLQG